MQLFRRQRCVLLLFRSHWGRRRLRVLVCTLILRRRGSDVLRRALVRRIVLLRVILWRGLFWRRGQIHLDAHARRGLPGDGSCAHKEVPVPSAIALVNTAVRSVFDSLVFIMSPHFLLLDPTLEMGKSSVLLIDLQWLISARRGGFRPKNDVCDERVNCSFSEPR